MAWHPEFAAGRKSPGTWCSTNDFALTDRKAVSEVLHQPQTMAAYALIPVGYPLGKFGPVTRKPLEEIMRFDRWSD